MAFGNYYVGSDLNNIGAQMQQDRDTQARAAIQQQEQQRLQYAALQDALLRREAQQQQANQFQQELAFRNAGQQHEDAYRNALLGLKQQEWGQISPAQAAENQYKYAALANALDQVREQAKAQQNTLGQQAMAAWINQNGLSQRDQQVADEAWQAEAIASKAKAAEYNARAKAIEDEAAARTKDSPWYEWSSTAKKASEDLKRQKYAELMAVLQQDKRPGTVSPNASGTGFIEVLRPRPSAQAPAGFSPTGINPLMFGQPQSFIQAPQTNSPLLSALAGTNTQSNANAPTNIVQSPGPSATYQSEIGQLQALARSGKIDRTNYIQRRAEIDAKYGIINR